jgi:cystathionine beta-lyase/cystathionine gamma-synthase
VHDVVAGALATKKKEELRRLLKDQIETGGMGLEEEDMYLLEINLGIWKRLLQERI